MRRKPGLLLRRCCDTLQNSAANEVQQLRLFASPVIARGSNLRTPSLNHGAWKGVARHWHSLIRPSGLPRPPELASNPAEIARMIRVWHACRQYLPVPYTNLPHWVVQKLLSIPEGWKHLMAQFPKDWAIRPAFHYRVAIANAMYISGARFQIILPAIMAESLRKSNYAHTLAGPGPVLAGTDPEKEWQPSSWLGWAVWYIKECLKDCMRLTQLVVLFLPLLCKAPFSMHSQGPRRENWLLLLRRTLEQAGPAFIKWGQWAATRKDMFPADFCQAMESLQTDAPSHSLASTRLAIQRAFGQSMEELFEDIQPEALASGSIGQVYKAQLSKDGTAYAGLEPGTIVAVKVRHPNVSRVIERDFRLMTKVFECLSWYYGSNGQRLSDTLKQFAGPLREQVDLAREARNLWQFNFNFRSNPRVRFPFPVYPLVTPEVLVETFEEGESINRFVQEGQAGKHNKRLAQLGTQAILQMLLVDNLIHLDLHPGNLLVSLAPPKGLLTPISTAARSSKIAEALQGKTVQPHIILLDTGMAASLTPTDQQNMVGLFTAFAKSDGQGVADSILRFSGESQSCPDTSAFVEAVKQHMASMRSAQQQNGTINGAESLGHLLDLVRQHQVSLPGQICGTVVTTLILEGWSSQLDPEHSVVDEVQRLIKLKSSPFASLETCITPQSLAVAGLA